jgi:hypothetical protein
MIWAQVFGFIAKYWRTGLIITAIVAVSGLWLHSQGQGEKIARLKADLALKSSVIEEMENARRAMERTAQHDRHNMDTAARSAAAVAAGRQGGDGPMAPVLRGEYDRVLDLAAKNPGYFR